MKSSRKHPAQRTRGRSFQRERGYQKGYGFNRGQGNHPDNQTTRKGNYVKNQNDSDKEETCFIGEVKENENATVSKEDIIFYLDSWSKS